MHFTKYQIAIIKELARMQRAGSKDYKKVTKLARLLSFSMNGKRG